MTSFLMHDPRVLEGQIVSLLKKSSDKRYTSNEILDVLAEKKLVRRSKKAQVVEALARVSTKGIQEKKSIRRALNERREVVYYYHKPSSKSFLCFLCGKPNLRWELLGGLYVGKVTVARLCESLPGVICEACFRVRFFGQCMDSVVATGVAVLPSSTHSYDRLVDAGNLEVETKEEAASTLVCSVRKITYALEAYAERKVRLGEAYMSLFQSFSKLRFPSEAQNLIRAFSLSSVRASSEMRETADCTFQAAFNLSLLVDHFYYPSGYGKVDPAQDTLHILRGDFDDLDFFEGLAGALYFVVTSNMNRARKLSQVWTDFFSYLTTDPQRATQVCRELALSITRTGADQNRISKCFEGNLNAAELQLECITGYWALGRTMKGIYNDVEACIYVAQVSALDATTSRVLNRECKKLRKLQDDKYLCTFLGVVADSGSLLFVWKDLPLHQTLCALLQDPSQHSLISGEEVPLALQICSGLEALHSHDPPIVHGDLSSASVFISPNLNVKIGNYGLRGSFGEKALLSRVACWSAPEIILGDPEFAYSKESDVYAYGITLWHLYALKAPYNSLHSAEALYAVAVDGLRPDMLRLPDELQPLVLKCVDQDPRQRPGLCDIRESLEQALPALAQ